MQKLRPSAYFSNFHKWAFTPKNAAFLYISDQFLNIIKPTLTGYYYG
jgi:selenocysteine lyase/cysteine desulfurase